MDEAEAVYTETVASLRRNVVVTVRERLDFPSAFACVETSMFHVLHFFWVGCRAVFRL